jgi:hypothetical protein
MKRKAYLRTNMGGSYNLQTRRIMLQNASKVLMDLLKMRFDDHRIVGLKKGAK